MEIRRELLAQILGPFASRQQTLFGAPAGEAGGEIVELAESVLQHLLRPSLPGQPLLIGSFDHNTGSLAPVTNRQYGIFMQQTGHPAPSYWELQTLGEQQHDHPVVGVSYFDAVSFNTWQRRIVPSLALLETFSRQGKFGKNEVLSEWASNTVGQGGPVAYSLSSRSIGYPLPVARFDDLGFRVGGSAIPNDERDEELGKIVLSRQ